MIVGSEKLSPTEDFNRASHLIIRLTTVNSKTGLQSPNDVLRSEEHNGEKTDQYEDGCETQ